MTAIYHDALTPAEQARLSHYFQVEEENQFDAFLETHMQLDCNAMIQIANSVLRYEAEHINNSIYNKYVLADELMIGGNAEWLVSIKKIAFSEQRISTYPFVSIIIPMKGTFRVKRYPFNERLDEFSLMDHPPNISTGTTIDSYENTFAVLDGRKNAFCFQGSEGTVVRLNLPLRHQVSWVYHDNLVPSHAVTTTPGIPGSMALISYCEAIQSPRSYRILEKLIAHQSFAIRWRAFQGLAKLSPERAIKFKDKLCSDPSWLIRSAAKKTFDTVST